MASHEVDVCTNYPDFAVICSFIENFGDKFNTTLPNIGELQTLIEDAENVSPVLIQTIGFLLRRINKGIKLDRWEKGLQRFAYSYSHKDAWELERCGFRKTKLEIKLRVIKNLLEKQFDLHKTFKEKINLMSAADLRLQPCGRDKFGVSYWCQIDDCANLRVYKDDQDEDTWELVARTKEEVLALIDQLQNTISNLGSIDGSGATTPMVLSEAPTPVASGRASPVDKVEDKPTFADDIAITHNETLKDGVETEGKETESEDVTNTQEGKVTEREDVTNTKEVAEKENVTNTKEEEMEEKTERQIATNTKEEEMKTEITEREVVTNTKEEKMDTEITEREVVTNTKEEKMKAEVTKREDVSAKEEKIVEHDLNNQVEVALQDDGTKDKFTDKKEHEFNIVSVAPINNHGEIQSLSVTKPYEDESQIENTKENLSDSGGSLKIPPDKDKKGMSKLVEQSGATIKKCDTPQPVSDAGSVDESEYSIETVVHSDVKITHIEDNEPSERSEEICPVTQQLDDKIIPEKADAIMVGSIQIDKPLDEPKKDAMLDLPEETENLQPGTSMKSKLLEHKSESLEKHPDPDVMITKKSNLPFDIKSLQSGSTELKAPSSENETKLKLEKYDRLKAMESGEFKCLKISHKFKNAAEQELDSVPETLQSEQQYKESPMNLDKSVAVNPVAIENHCETNPMPPKQSNETIMHQDTKSSETKQQLSESAELTPTVIDANQKETNELCTMEQLSETNSLEPKNSINMESIDSKKSNMSEIFLPEKVCKMDQPEIEESTEAMPELSKESAKTESLLASPVSSVASDKLKQHNDDNESTLLQTERPSESMNSVSLEPKEQDAAPFKLEQPAQTILPCATTETVSCQNNQFQQLPETSREAESNSELVLETTTHTSLSIKPNASIDIEQSATTNIQLDQLQPEEVKKEDKLLYEQLKDSSKSPQLQSGIIEKLAQPNDIEVKQLQLNSIVESKQLQAGQSDALLSENVQELNKPNSEYSGLLLPQPEICSIPDNSAKTLPVQIESSRGLDLKLVDSVASESLTKSEPLQNVDDNASKLFQSDKSCQELSSNVSKPGPLQTATASLPDKMETEVSSMSDNMVTEDHCPINELVSEDSVVQEKVQTKNISLYQQLQSQNSNMSDKMQHEVSGKSEPLYTESASTPNELQTKNSFLPDQMQCQDSGMQDQTKPEDSCKLESLPTESADVSHQLKSEDSIVSNPLQSEDSDQKLGNSVVEDKTQTEDSSKSDAFEPEQLAESKILQDEKTLKASSLPDTNTIPKVHLISESSQMKLSKSSDCPKNIDEISHNNDSKGCQEISTTDSKPQKEQEESVPSLSSCDPMTKVIDGISVSVDCQIKSKEVSIQKTVELCKDSTSVLKSVVENENDQPTTSHNVIADIKNTKVVEEQPLPKSIVSSESNLKEENTMDIDTTEQEKPLSSGKRKHDDIEPCEQRSSKIQKCEEDITERQEDKMLIETGSEGTTQEKESIAEPCKILDNQPDLKNEKLVKPSVEIETENKEELPGEAIEEPIMIISGEGEGKKCDSGKPWWEDFDNCQTSCGEATIEEILYVSGEGNGIDCDAGNEDETETLETDKSSSSPVKNVDGHPKNMEKSHETVRNTLKVNGTNSNTEEVAKSDFSNKDSETNCVNQKNSKVESDSDVNESKVPIKPNQKNIQSAEELTNCETSADEEEKTVAIMPTEKRDDSEKALNDDSSQKDTKTSVATTEKFVPKKMKGRGRPKKGDSKSPSKGSHNEDIDSSDEEVEEQKLKKKKPEPEVTRHRSARIAKIREREEAERIALEAKRLDQLALENKRRARDERRMGRESKKEHGEEKESKKKKKKKKRIKPKKNGSDPWSHSSTSSSSSSDEAMVFEEIEEENEELVFKSDHEFSPESELEDEDAQPIKRARTARKLKPEPSAKPEEKVDDENTGFDDTSCTKCNHQDHPETILLCDICDSGWHLSCLRPPLLSVPEGDWTCPSCEHNALIEKLRALVSKYDTLKKKAENEELRRQRLAYINISLENALPDIKQRKRHSEPEDDSTGSSDEESETGSESGSSSGSDAPLYTLRARPSRTPKEQVKDFDEMINEAIRDELEAVENVKRVGTFTRGKDIANIVEGEVEEPEPSEADEAEERDETKVESSQIGEENEPEKNVAKATPQPKRKRSVESDEEESEDEPPVKTKRRGRIAMAATKKRRRLTDLDAVEDEDDDDSDESFKGSSEFNEDSEESEDDDDKFSSSFGTETDESDDSDLVDVKASLRRSARGRNLPSDYDSEPERMVKKRRKNRYETTSEEEETSSDDSYSKKRVKRKPPPKRPAKKPTKKPPPTRKPVKKSPNTTKTNKDTKPKVRYSKPAKQETEEDAAAKRRVTRGRQITYYDNLYISDDDDDLIEEKPKSRGKVMKGERRPTSSSDYEESDDEMKKRRGVKGGLGRGKVMKDDDGMDDSEEEKPPYRGKPAAVSRAPAIVTPAVKPIIKAQNSPVSAQDSPVVSHPVDSMLGDVGKVTTESVRINPVLRTYPEPVIHTASSPTPAISSVSITPIPYTTQIQSSVETSAKGPVKTPVVKPPDSKPPVGRNSPGPTLKWSPHITRPGTPPRHPGTPPRPGISGSTPPPLTYRPPVAALPLTTAPPTTSHPTYTPYRPPEHFTHGFPPGFPRHPSMPATRHAIYGPPHSTYPHGVLRGPDVYRQVAGRGSPNPGHHIMMKSPYHTLEPLPYSGSPGPIDARARASPPQTEEPKETSQKTKDEAREFSGGLISYFSSQREDDDS